MKSLHALEIILNCYVCRDLERDEWEQIKNIFPKSSEIIEKSLKALEIIKNHFKISKPVGVSIEKNSVGIGGLIQIKDLTIEEYSLLKELWL